MNTTFKDQMRAIEIARRGAAVLVGRDSIIEFKSILNDAASTIASLNLGNPYEQIKEQAARIEKLEGILQMIAVENYDDDDKKHHLRAIIDRMKGFAKQVFE